MVTFVLFFLHALNSQERRDYKIETKKSDHRSCQFPKNAATLLPGTIAEDTFDHGGRTACNDDRDAMTDSK